MTVFDGDFWKNARLKQGYSQLDIAKKLNYSSAQLISNWERGMCSPPQKNLKALLKIYKISPDTYINEYIANERKRLKKLLKQKSS